MLPTLSDSPYLFTVEIMATVFALEVLRTPLPAPDKMMRSAGGVRRECS